MEGNFAITSSFPVFHANGSYTVLVCFNVDGFISGEGACKHFSGLNRCGVEGGGGKGGVPDRHSSSLNSISEECSEFVINGSIDA